MSLTGPSLPFPSLVSFFPCQRAGSKGCFCQVLAKGRQIIRKASLPILRHDRSSLAQQTTSPASRKQLRNTHSVGALDILREPYRSSPSLEQQPAFNETHLLVIHTRPLATRHASPSMSLLHLLNVQLASHARGTVTGSSSLAPRATQWLIASVGRRPANASPASTLDASIKYPQAPGWRECGSGCGRWARREMTGL
ncbi:hypothetical protein BKA80DRAFT_274098, partial [Phyllosticta citrichinensis]